MNIEENIADTGDYRDNRHFHFSRLLRVGSGHNHGSFRRT
jgi:hypothetical protein